LIVGDDELSAHALTVRDMRAKRDFPRAVDLAASGAVLRATLAHLTEHRAERHT